MTKAIKKDNKAIEILNWLVILYEINETTIVCRIAETLQRKITSVGFFNLFTYLNLIKRKCK